MISNNLYNFHTEQKSGNSIEKTKGSVLVKKPSTKLNSTINKGFTNTVTLVLMSLFLSSVIIGIVYMIYKISLK